MPKQHNQGVIILVVKADVRAVVMIRAMARAKVVAMRSAFMDVSSMEATN